MNISKFISADNYALFIATLLSTLISCAFFGMGSITFSAVAVLFVFLIDSAKQNNGDYFYTFFWMFIILLGCYIGFKLKLSIGFYIFLFIISNYYYRSFDTDPFSARAVPFIVIFATIGTMLDHMNYQSAISYGIGTVISLLVLVFAHKKKIEFAAFKYGLFSKTIYRSNQHILLSSFIYSIFLFFCIFIPDHFHLDGVYWGAIAFVILLKPKAYHIVKDTLKRFLGCVAGGLFTIAVINLGFHSRIAVIIIILVCVFLTPTLFAINKIMKSFTITIFVLLVIEYAFLWTKASYTLSISRAYETLIGGVMAILTSIILHYIDKIRHPV